jgi:hypothetical protein
VRGKASDGARRRLRPYFSPTARRRAGPPSPDRDRRHAQLEMVEKKLGAEWDKELNARFFEDAVEKTRTRLLAAYARAHCAEIDAP